MEKHEEIINRYLEECPLYESSPSIGIDLTEYAEFLTSCNRVIMPSELSGVKIDYRGLLKYAQSQGKALHELSNEEMSMFVLEKPAK